jgi:aspartyl-tRNA(Asn)/glutamyl-tRNA(Gln) amidotransferase subunit A
MGKVEDKVKGYLAKIKKDNGKINAVLHLNSRVLQEARGLDKKKGKRGRLHGYIFGIKSNINVRGQNVNCASITLENYKAGYDASVIEKIKAEDGLIIGMLNMDEFACGSSGETSAFGACQNPRAMGKIPGGSSSGSAAAVAAGFCDVSLGSDTGGSIRNPASHCGIVGVKPSYGLVSRYGLIDLSMSLDQIGPLGKNVRDCALVLDVISGKDERDTMSYKSEKINLNGSRKVRIGVVKVDGVEDGIQKKVDSVAEKLKKELKWGVREIKMKYIDLAVQTYYPLVYVEFFSATRRFDGRKYGKKIENYCGEEVLRRILGGSEISKAEFKGKYYQKALEVKELIKGEFARVLRDVDCLLMPTVPSLPWDVGAGKKMKVEEVYVSDSLTCPVNLAEACAISLPCGDLDGIPIGMQVICGKGNDETMLSIAGEIEKLSSNFT